MKDTPLAQYMNNMHVYHLICMHIIKTFTVVLKLVSDTNSDTNSTHLIK